MSSRSLLTWRGVATRALDEIEAAHMAVGGRGRGRRYATQQINQAYAVMLSSQFQRFCRDLHSEAVDALAGTISSLIVRDIFRSQMTGARKLDTGNPNPGNVGSDFGRLGMNFWPALSALNTRNIDRRSVELRLSQVRRWRASCGALATQFDVVVAQRLTTILGVAPW
jgi:hypothetical protein